VFHYNHIHIDLARHSGGRRVCKPLIKFEPRLNTVAATSLARPVPTAPARASGPYVTPPPLPASGRPMMLDFPQSGAYTPEGADAEDADFDQEPASTTAPARAPVYRPAASNGPIPPAGVPYGARRYP
jgi:hypothetical protein